MTITLRPPKLPAPAPTKRPTTSAGWLTVFSPLLKEARDAGQRFDPPAEALLRETTTH